MEKQIRRLMHRYGYNRTGFLAKELDGKSASGFKYTYAAQNVGMFGETYVLKSGKALYGFNFYARQEFEQESLTTWEELLDSVRWG